MSYLGSAKYNVAQFSTVDSMNTNSKLSKEQKVRAKELDPWIGRLDFMKFILAYTLNVLIVILLCKLLSGISLISKRGVLILGIYTLLWTAISFLGDFLYESGCVKIFL